ncbi:MAG TPA: TIGR00730 family Rossman fold protein [Nitrospiraceae bacterium]|nr:TIGR00730 family Rossman fold protein [Nitrospiraceae bacterium]
MKGYDSAARLGLTNEDILKQVQTLLDGAHGDLRTTLRKEILLTILRMSDAQLDTLDLKILNRTLRELRHAFKVFYPYRHRPKVCFFGSARTPAGDPNHHLAIEFSRLLVARGFMVITGGGDGIMGAAQEGAGKENSFGLNIMLPFEQGPNATIADDHKLITFKYFFTRKLMFLKESHATALFPGGFGTHDETFEVLTLLQTGKSHPQPIVCLQAPGNDYWDRWYDFIMGQLLSQRLISEEDLSLFKIFTSAEEAVEEIENFYRTYHSSRFVHHHLVLRLKHPLAEDQLDTLHMEFRDLLVQGKFALRDPFPEEQDEAALQHLPRLVFHYNRRSAGRLRQLIDRVNSFPLPATVSAGDTLPPPAGL